MAEAWEDAARLAGQGELTRTASEKILNGLLQSLGRQTIKRTSISDTLDGFLKSRRELGMKEGTIKAYSPIFNSLKTFLGAGRCVGSIESLDRNELKQWQRSLVSSGLVATTVNKYIKVVGAALNDADIHPNPAHSLQLLDASTANKQPFTDEEIRHLLKATDSKEWRGMIMLGAWTGIRLSDAASLTWTQIDLDEGRLAYIPAKRSRKLHRNLEVALHSEAIKFLQEAERGIGRTPVFPTLNGRRSGSGGANAGGLSNEFGRIVERAGIKNQLLREGKGKGRDVWEKSFHSLRHTMISRMTNAEVSKDVRKAIAGHSTDFAHERYTHLSFDKQKTTISRLPSLAS